jgi:hypothetical protein
MSLDDEVRTYAQMGMAAMLPGMEYALELMQRQIDEIRARLAELQEADRSARNAPAPKRARPTGGWPEEAAARKREMARRMTVARAKAKGEKISQAQRKTWDEMSPRKRKQRLAAMAAGKAANKKKHHVNGAAAA